MHFLFFMYSVLSYLSCFLTFKLFLSPLFFKHSFLKIITKFVWQNCNVVLVTLSLFVWLRLPLKADIGTVVGPDIKERAGTSAEMVSYSRTKSNKQTNKHRIFGSGTETTDLPFLFCSVVKHIWHQGQRNHITRLKSSPTPPQKNKIKLQRTSAVPSWENSAVFQVRTAPHVQQMGISAKTVEPASTFLGKFTASALQVFSWHCVFSGSLTHSHCSAHIWNSRSDDQHLSCIDRHIPFCCDVLNFFVYFVFKGNIIAC